MKTRIRLKYQHEIGILACCLTIFSAVASTASPSNMRVSLTADERAWLAEHPVIRLAPDPDFPPIEFIDSNGSYQGIAALKTRAPVIANDPENDSRSGGTPPGHPPLKSFMAVPLYAGKNIVGLAGVANRKSGYDTELLESLEPFIATCSNLIVEYRNERQRVETENLVKQNQIRLQVVLDNVLESIITINQRGVVQSVNPPTSDIFGYEPEEIVGQNVKMLIPEPHRSAHDQYLENYHNTRVAKIMYSQRGQIYLSTPQSQINLSPLSWIASVLGLRNHRMGSAYSELSGSTGS